MNALWKWSLAVGLIGWLMINVGNVRAQEKPAGLPSVVGVIPRAMQPPQMDGKLDNWTGAFVTPLNATHPDLFNRATHIYYLWDAQALYIGVRALDANPTHITGDNTLYDGDAIEFYLDTRSRDDLGKAAWTPGTLHMFFTAVTGHDIKPRWHVRDLPAFANLNLKGMEMAAERTPNGYTLAFKLPWVNFPGFTPASGALLGLDIEMGSADGGHRTHRAFAYSSPASVDTPATFGRVMLVEHIETGSLSAYSRALMPFDAQVPGNYGRIYGVACLSPTIADQVANVNGRLLDAQGKERKRMENPRLTTIAGHWRQWRGEWETYDLPPGMYTLVLTAQDAQNHVLAERRLRVLLEPSP